jgi:hypothetical protein
VRLLLRWGQWMSGQRPRMVVGRRDGGLGIHCGQQLHGSGCCLHGLGGILVSFVR